MSADYQSIFFSDQWAHTKYYGWDDIYTDSKLKIWEKKDSGLPIKRFMILSRGESPENISKAISDAGIFQSLSIVHLHEFSAVDEKSHIELAGHSFSLAKNSERLLNIGTFVIDLSQSEEQLWERMGATSKNKTAWRQIKKAEKQKLNCNYISEYNEKALRDFFANYNRMAKERNLSAPAFSTIEKMLKEGHLLIQETTDESGKLLVTLLIYLAGDLAFYLYGATAEENQMGMSIYAHWNCMKKLKSMNYKFYDMGGVPSKDAANGIYRFKKSLGGSYFDLGSEYRYVPAVLTYPMKLVGYLRRRLSAYGMG